MTVFCQEPAPERVRPRRRAVVRPELRAGCCRSSCSTATRARGPAAPGSHPGRARALRRGERRRAPRASAADLVFTNHVLMGGPVGAAAGARFGSRRTAPSSSTRCAAAPSSSAGAESPRGADAVFVGSQHIRGCSRRSPATSTGLRGPAGRRHRRVRPQPRDEALEGSWPRRAAILRTRERRRAASGRGQRRAARGFFAARADRRLLREADREQGRTRSCSRPCARSMPGRSSSALATTVPSSNGWPRREPVSSRARSSTAISPICSRSPM